MEKRIFEEGNNSKADILFLADAGALYSAQNKNLFSKIKSEFIKKKVPISLRNDFWVGITKRSRILYYNPNFLSKSYCGQHVFWLCVKLKLIVILR